MQGNPHIIFHGGLVAEEVDRPALQEEASVVLGEVHREGEVQAEVGNFG